MTETQPPRHAADLPPTWAPAEVAAGRLTKDLAAAEKELAGCEGKLANPSVTDRAPADVVAKVRERCGAAAADVDRIASRLAALPLP